MSAVSERPAVRRAVRFLVAAESVRRGSAAEIRTLLGACGEVSLAWALRAQRLAPLAALRWRGQPLPNDLTYHLDQQLAASRARALALEALGDQLLDAVSSRGVSVLTLKGPWLSESAFGDPGARIANDIDLLVDRGSLGEAGEALESFGYRRSEAWPSEIHRTYRAPGLPRVELHWRVHWFESAFSAAMLDRATPDTNGRLVAEPADELAALLLYCARDGLFGVRGPGDVAGFADRHEVDGDALEMIASTHPELRRALAITARYVAELTGARLPRIASKQRRRERFVVALANPDADREVDQASSDSRLVDVLLAPHGQRGAAVRRHTWLPGGQLRAIYGVRAAENRGIGRTRETGLRVFQAVKAGTRFATGLSRGLSRGDR